MEYLLIQLRILKINVIALGWKKEFLSKNFEGLNKVVVDNFNKLKINAFIFPVTLLLCIVWLLYFNDGMSVEGYVNVQKDSFFYINSILSKFPNFQFNLTQLGDVLIFLPFLTLLLVYAPKLWQSMLIGLLVSTIFTNVLKSFFALPRPAAMFDRDVFVITGKAIVSHNSFPSGHSIATFTILTSILFAFMPSKIKFKIPWFILIFMIGSVIAFSRVAVGAHYPLDVIIGSIIGYISALLGIIINRRFSLLDWLTDKKYYFISIILFSIWAILIINRILTLNLVVFYFALASLLASLYIITTIYVKKAY
ncbi:phosphatase PAP2 family protein [Subsaxibacter sp. CAU 1640]|uniref:phosphatase PAP2 family protein n=1 Tax=Subsaxibacter sp. CAU 1640 TaxID=2933271 RepID=UPI002002DCC6|nr:phosphatase PAP2 family protein [Subsaxibacter sp. CAU 1640]MCK7591339.1 phosphatase PAP2 family protein [Subsaxibacter sp. CAU 1640]